MEIADLLEIGFRDAPECPPAWQHNGKVLCRDFGRALISILWYTDSSEIDVLVGDVQTSLLPMRSPVFTLAHLQHVLRDYWPAS